MKAIQLLAMFTAGRLVCAASCAAVLCACRLSAFGGMDEVVLKCETNIAPCSYKVGEAMKFSFSLIGLDASEPIAGMNLRWKRQGAGFRRAGPPRLSRA